MLTEHSIKTGPSGYGALCNCSAHRPVKPDLSVPVTGSPPALSSLYSSPAAQEAKAGPISRAWSSLGSEFEVGRFPPPPEVHREYPIQGPQNESWGLGGARPGLGSQLVVRTVWLATPQAARLTTGSSAGLGPGCSSGLSRTWRKCCLSLQKPLR